jgi:hypothetical protein
VFWWRVYFLGILSLAPHSCILNGRALFLLLLEKVELQPGPCCLGAGISRWYSTGPRAGWSGVRQPAGAGNFPFHHRVQTSSGAHPAPYPKNNMGFFPGDRGVKLTSQFHLVFRSRMRGFIPPLSNTPPWRGAQLNTRTTLLLPHQIYFVLRTILLKGLTKYLRAFFILIDRLWWNFVSTVCIIRVLIFRSFTHLNSL